MADNEKTYKTTIEVETNDAAKNIDLLNKKVSTSLGDFENLNEAIGKTQDTLGKLDPKSDEFKELSKELQTLKDNLKDTEIQSVRFTEALAAQPGVIGFVGQSLEGLRGTFKVFMANPIIAVLAGIAGALLALRESLTRTEEGTAKLNKITEGFTKILNGLFAIIEPIAMQLADLVVGLLENDKVMDGLSKTVGVLTGVFTTLFGILQSTAGFIINTLVNNFKTLIGVAKGAGDVIAGVFTFDWDRIKEGANAAFDAVTEGVKGTVDNVKTLGNGIVDAAVSGFKAGEKGFKEGFSRLTEAEKEAAEKTEEERKKRAEEQQKALEEAQRVQTEAYISLLDARSAELYTREQKYQEDLKKLKAAGITDFTQLEEVYRRDVADINKKYDDEAIAKQQEQIAKQKELLDGITEYRSIEDRLLSLENELATIGLTFDRQRELIAEKEALLLEQEGLTEEQRTAIKRAAADERIAIDQMELDARADIQNAQLDLLEQFGGFLSQIAGENKKLQIAAVIAEQVAAIGRIIVNTAVANAKAVAASPLTFGQPWVTINTVSAALGIASSVAAGVKAVRDIKNSDKGASPSGGTKLPRPAAPRVSGASVPQTVGYVVVNKTLVDRLRKQLLEQEVEILRNR
jgi:hypothetical protein